MRKRILSGILSIILLIAAAVFFVSCGGGGNKILVRVGLWSPAAGSSSAEIEYYEAQKEKFEKAYPQYKIEATPYTYKKASITAKVISGQLPVLFQVSSTDIDYLKNNSYIADLTGKLESFGWLGEMDTDMRGLVTVGNAVCGIPKESCGLGMFINLKLFHEAGLIGKDDDGYVLYDGGGQPLYPTTFEQLRSAAEGIVSRFGADKVSGIAVLASDGFGGRQFSNMAWNFGLDSFVSQDENGVWTSNINSAPAVDAMRWIQTMRRENLIYHSSTYLSYNDWYKKIGEGEVAIAFCNSDSLAQPITNYGFDLNDIAFVPMPGLTDSSRYIMNGCPAYVFSAKATDAQIEGAMRFLKYLGASPDTDEVSQAARSGYLGVIRNENHPILPSKKAWAGTGFKQAASALHAEYSNVNYNYYRDFFESFDGRTRDEEKHYRYALYSLLDTVIQKVLAAPLTTGVYGELTAIKQTFDSNYISRMNA